MGPRTDKAAAMPGAESASGRRRTLAAAATSTVPANVSPSRLIDTAAPQRRSNRRSEQTIENIFACTEAILLKSGAERISILDVCRAADVSRGTFYRYFASQEELLHGFSRHVRERFHRSLLEAVAPHSDPEERLVAIIRFVDEFLASGRGRRLLQVAPEYAPGFFQRIFHDSTVRFQDALGIVFDAWEARHGIRVDRELVAEMLIRYVLSELLVPSEGDRTAVVRRIGRMAETLLAGAPARARR